MSMVDPRIATIYDADHTGPLFFAKGQDTLRIPYSASLRSCCPREAYGYYPKAEPNPSVKAIPINTYPYYHNVHQNPNGTWPRFVQEPNGKLY